VPSSEVTRECYSLQITPAPNGTAVSSGPSLSLISSCLPEVDLGLLRGIFFTSVMQGAAKHNLRVLPTKLSPAIACICPEGAA
jgi:hypothetical protein